MNRQNVSKLFIVLFLLLALLGAAALGPRVAGAGKTVSPQHSLLVCASGQLPPCD